MSNRPANQEQEQVKARQDAAQTQADQQRAATEQVRQEKGATRLEHSQGGVTTRDDILDAGVPMLPGDPRERTGPEDALGVGPKRGDYTQRVGPSSYHPHVSEPIPAEEREPGGPVVRLVPQRPLVQDIGDEPRLKGGVDTDPASRVFR